MLLRYTRGRIAVLRYLQTTSGQHSTLILKFPFSKNKDNCSEKPCLNPYVHFATNPYSVPRPTTNPDTLVPPYYPNAFKSNGTLLPLPARYFFGPPTNSLGLGNLSSVINFHRLSCTT